MHRNLKASRARAQWLETAPDYVLDCFDHPATIDRYTVAIALDGSGGKVVSYLSMSSEPGHPQGFSQWGEWTLDQFAAYRREQGKRRVRWLDIPDKVRKHCRDRVEQD